MSVAQTWRGFHRITSLPGFPKQVLRASLGRYNSSDTFPADSNMFVEGPPPRVTPSYKFFSKSKPLQINSVRFLSDVKAPERPAEHNEKFSRGSY